MADPLSPFQCPACFKTFRSVTGKEAHLSTAQSCSWYKLDQLENLPGDIPDLRIQEDPAQEIDTFLDQPPLTEHDYYFDDVFLDQYALFPTGTLPGAEPSSQEPNAPPLSQIQPPRALDDVDDTRYVETHPSAGKVLSHCFEDADGDVLMDNHRPEDFSPFSSELDWKIAEWAIKDSIGHNSFDRFLAIPGVSTSLSYI